MAAGERRRSTDGGAPAAAERSTRSDPRGVIHAERSTRSDPCGAPPPCSARGSCRDTGASAGLGRGSEPGAAPDAATGSADPVLWEATAQLTLRIYFHVDYNVSQRVNSKRVTPAACLRSDLGRGAPPWPLGQSAPAGGAGLVGLRAGGGGRAKPALSFPRPPSAPGDSRASSVASGARGPASASGRGRVRAACGAEVRVALRHACPSCPPPGPVRPRTELVLRLLLLT